MKGSLIIVGFFLLGVACGVGDVFPINLAETDISFYALCALMCCVGIGLGSDPQTLRNFRSLSPRLALLPAGTILGTLAGALVVNLCLAHRSGPAGQHLPRDSHSPACPAAGTVVWTIGTHCRRRRHDDGHYPAHHRPDIGTAVCHCLHLPRLSGRLQCAVPRDAVLRSLKWNIAACA